MMEFQEKRKLKRVLYSKVVLIILLLLILFGLKQVLDIYTKQRLTRDNLAKTATVYDGLQAREKMLSSEIDRLKTQAGTEEEIREKYGLVKPGEEVLTVVDGDDNSGLDSPSTPISFWQRVIDWMK
jgi:cell division protein FtsB